MRFKVIESIHPTPIPIRAKRLTFDKDQQLLFCCCRETPEKIPGDNLYITGNSISKRDNVKKKWGWHSLRTQVAKVDDAALRDVRMKMNVAYCIAKEELPFTKFKLLILLCKNNWVVITPSYDNHIQCGEMISTTDDEMESHLAEETKGSCYFSVMIDGDTDASNN